jgi:hypothetical protein
MTNAMIRKTLANGKQVKISVKKSGTTALGLVWCTECATQLPKDVKVIKSHFLAEHKMIPGSELLTKVLTNRECINGLISTGVILPTPTDGVSDYDRLHSGKLHGEVSAGAYGLGKRR